MWDCQVEEVDNRDGQKCRLLHDSEPVSYSRVLALWQSDPLFREFFIAQLVDSRYLAFRWETPPISKATQDRPFEFVLLQCDGLDRQADPEAFVEQFDSANGKEVLSFPNLGGDAVMVVPCPVCPETSYAHLAAFVRSASKEQVDQLWQAVGQAMQQRLSDRPVWLSTAGMGVSWLHVRLDSRPKYYGYRPYTRVE